MKRKPHVPTPEEVRLAIAQETEQPMMLLRDWEITSDSRLCVLRQKAALNLDDRLCKIYLDADKRHRQAELEMLAIRTGRASWLEMEIKDQPIKDRAFARLQWRQIRLDQEIDVHRQILERLYIQREKTAEKLALLEQDPTIKTRTPMEKELRKLWHPVTPLNKSHYMKFDVAALDVSRGACLQCHKPHRLTRHKADLARYCSSRCRQAAYRARKKIISTISKPVS